MRLRLAAVSILAFSALSLAAHAVPTDSFSITGLDASNNAYTFDFTFDPTGYVEFTGDGGEGYQFATTGSVNGSPDNFLLDVTYYGITDALDLTDALNTYSFLVQPNATDTFLTGTYPAPPVITPDTYSGVSDFGSCIASLTKPALFRTVPTTMAFFQAPSITLADCGPVVLAPLSGGSVTPEPSTLGLLATGALAMGGVIRRRFRVASRA